MRKKITSARQIESRESRLSKARLWIPSYKGDHIARDYAKHFGVDYECALNEIEILGALPPESIANMREGLRMRRLKRREKTEER
jgi:hypothetical protein